MNDEPFLDLATTMRDAATSIVQCADVDRLACTVAALNEIERSVAACGIVKVETPTGARAAIEHAIDELSKTGHPPHVTVVNVLNLLLRIVDNPTMAQEDKTMLSIAAIARRYE